MVRPDRGGDDPTDGLQRAVLDVGQNWRTLPLATLPGNYVFGVDRPVTLPLAGLLIKYQWKANLRERRRRVPNSHSSYWKVVAPRSALASIDVRHQAVMGIAIARPALRKRRMLRAKRIDPQRHGLRIEAAPGSVVLRHEVEKEIVWVIGISWSRGPAEKKQVRREAWTLIRLEKIICETVGRGDLHVGLHIGALHVRILQALVLVVYEFAEPVHVLATFDVVLVKPAIPVVGSVIVMMVRAKPGIQRLRDIADFLPRPIRRGAIAAVIDVDARLEGVCRAALCAACRGRAEEIVGRAVFLHHDDNVLERALGNGLAVREDWGKQGETQQQPNRHFHGKPPFAETEIETASFGGS